MLTKIEFALLLIAAALFIAAAYYLGALDDMSIRGRG